MSLSQKHGIKALLIDDDPLFGNLLTRKASAHGIKLEYRSSLVEALYEGYLRSYDVAILDCVMPELSGFEVSHYLATFLEDISVILVSQSDSSFAKFLQDGCGAVTFISKEQGADAIFAAAKTATLGRSKKAVAA